MFGEPETQKDDEDEEDKDSGEEWTAPADAPIDIEEKESLMKESMGLNVSNAFFLAIGASIRLKFDLKKLLITNRLLVDPYRYTYRSFGVCNSCSNMDRPLTILAFC